MPAVNNPSPGPFPGNPALDRIMSIAQRAGRWGILGMVLLATQEIIYCSTHFSVQQLMSSLGTLGWEVTLIGVLADTKRLKDMTATVAAEAKIDRAVLSTTLPGPNVKAESADPAVQRAIETQVANGRSQAKAIIEQADKPAV